MGETGLRMTLIRGVNGSFLQLNCVKGNYFFPHFKWWLDVCTAPDIIETFISALDCFINRCHISGRH